MDDPKRNTKDYLQPRAAAIVKDIETITEADARAVMKTYREALADLNAFKG
jgi:hypothetical protein